MGPTTAQGGSTHPPRSQSSPAAHAWPQAPQLCGSFARSAQPPSHVVHAPVAPPCPVAPASPPPAPVVVVTPTLEVAVVAELDLDVELTAAPAPPHAASARRSGRGLRIGEHLAGR